MFSLRSARTKKTHLNVRQYGGHADAPCGYQWLMCELRTLSYSALTSFGYISHQIIKSFQFFIYHKFGILEI